jgi:DNA-3-methyladenine glycosylase II
MECSITTITPTPPYDFDLTAGYSTYFRGQYGAETFREGLFRRLLDCGGHLCLVTVRSVGTVDSPLLEVELEKAEAGLEADLISEAKCQVAWILETDQNLESFYRMAMSDSAMEPLVLALRGLHVPHTPSVYEALVLAILGQQISSHVARMVRTLLIQTYGSSAEVEGVTYHAFPRPEAILEAGVEGLRAIKFSARKAEYITDIAARVASGEMDLEGLRHQPDEEVVRTLVGIRGVGLWTAQWLLIRALGRTDGFPHGDLALQRFLGLLVGRGTSFSSEEALEYSRRWSPFRSYITTYLFAAARSGRFEALLQAGQVRP